MEKARFAAARLFASCLVVLILYPRSWDMTSQDRSDPTDHRSGNPPDRPMPFHILDVPMPEPDAEMASLLGKPPYQPLVTDDPVQLVLPKNTGQARKPAAKATALVVIRIDQATQRLAVYFDGEEVPGLDSVLVSTGRPGKATRTPNGTYSPRAMAVRRQSNFASRLVKRPVYLTHAIQIVDGIFMHDASHAAMPFLGEKRSYGCVRVDRRKMPAIFRLVKQHRSDTQIQIFQSSRDEVRRDLPIASSTNVQTTRSKIASRSFHPGFGQNQRVHPLGLPVQRMP